MLGVFLDTEANGLNFQIHKILEIAFKIVDLSTGEVKEEYQSIVLQPMEVWEKSDTNSLLFTGFTWHEVSQGRAPHNIAEHIINSFKHWGILRKKAVFICQNPSFDRVLFSQLIDPDTQEMLNWPYHWLDLASMFWALTLDRAKRGEGPPPWETGYTKDSIASHYQLPSEPSPHRAMNGVSHLILCYEAAVGFFRKK